MSVGEKVAKLKSEMRKSFSRYVLKFTALATLLGSPVAVSSCVNGDKDTEKEETKTSVVFRTTQYKDKTSTESRILLENGDIISSDCYANIHDINYSQNGEFLEAGDTVTYQGNHIQAIRYKNGPGKQVNFGEIGKIKDDVTR